MLKSFSFCLLLVACLSVRSNAQDIGTDEAQLIEKISKKMANEGFFQRVLFDTATNIFEGEAGKKYRVISAFNASSEEARRLIVYKLKDDGSNKKSYTSKASKGYRDGGAQIFILSLPALSSKETALKMKVDARPIGKVYVFSN